MNQNAFLDACERIINQQRERKSIGTLGEKTLHAILKYYFEPDDQYHEIKKEGYVADISYGNEVIEIQTQGFNKLRGKLTTFLKNGVVTVVYPIPYQKWIQWIDEETGEIKNRRKSNKKGSVYEAFFELYKIKPFLIHPNLRLSFVLVDIEEQRILNGWSSDKKRGASRYERIPLTIVKEINIIRVQDYEKLLPEGLNEVFSTKEYKACSGVSIGIARTAVHVLNYVGVIRKVGKKGNLILYSKTIGGNTPEEYIASIEQE